MKLTSKAIQLFSIRNMQEQQAGSSITITLERWSWLSREICWWSPEAVREKWKANNRYNFAQVNTLESLGINTYFSMAVNRSSARSIKIEISNSTDFSGFEEVIKLKLNDIGKVKFKTEQSRSCSIPNINNKSNGSLYSDRWRAVLITVSVWILSKKNREKRLGEKRFFLQSNFNCSTIKIH